MVRILVTAEDVDALIGARRCGRAGALGRHRGQGRPDALRPHGAIAGVTRGRRCVRRGRVGNVRVGASVALGALGLGAARAAGSYGGESTEQREGCESNAGGVGNKHAATLARGRPGAPGTT